MMLAQSRSGLLVLALCSAVLSGCVSTTFHPSKDYQPLQTPPVPPDRVAQLGSFPAEPCQTLGTIEAWVTGYLSQKRVSLEVRKAAADIGADAIVETGPRLYADAPIVAEQYIAENRCVSLSVTAVRFKPPPPSP